MNVQTKFYYQLIAKKKAYQEMIEDGKRHAKTHSATADFFINEVVRYEAKLEAVEDIINDYLNN
jgi:hypothetical protein